MIELKNLSFAYRHTAVFSDITLSLPDGAIYGLLGENGVGKTTLMKLMCGLLRPTAGTCQVDGAEASRRLPSMLQRMVLLPDKASVPDSSTPERYAHSLQPFYPNYFDEKFRLLMQELEVERDRRFSEMSTGQHKKSMIAVALALGTDYVLLDEPTNGLDIPSKAQLRSILSHRADERTTLVIATHQVKDVENLIDPIVILNSNAVLLNASVQRITERLAFLYEPEARPDALYSERRPGGYLNVVPNRGSLESMIDIEALFNAVLRNKEQVKAMFH